MGGAGNDIIHGRLGRDFLIGGAGSDQLWGNQPAGAASSNDGDILVGGTTTQDASLAALGATSNAWAARQPVSVTAIDDGVVDTLNIRRSIDLWFAQNADVVNILS